MANALNDMFTVADHFSKRIRRFERDLRSALASAEQAILCAWVGTEDAHRRSARLNAYRLRKQWKGSDAKRLRAIGLGPAGASWLERAKLAKPRGRPIVPPYLSLATQMVAFGLFSEVLFNPSTSPHLRRRALRMTPWWEYFVEAVYRGEYETARTVGGPSPFARAEQATGRAFGLSPDRVRRIAGKVRKMRRQGTALPKDPPLTARQFAVWERTGAFPKEASGLAAEPKP